MKISFQLLVILLTLSCKQTPNYHPFDNQFDVSISQLIRDNCEQISVECGYYNWVQPTGRLRTYYQIYSETPGQVVAKGFEYRLDTFKIKNFRDRYTDKNRLDSLVLLPFDVQEMNSAFGKYKYKFLDRNLDSLRIVNWERKDTISLRLIVYHDYRYQFVVRGISYFNSEEHREAPNQWTNVANQIEGWRVRAASSSDNY